MSLITDGWPGGPARKEYCPQRSPDRRQSLPVRAALTAQVQPPGNHPAPTHILHLFLEASNSSAFWLTPSFWLTPVTATTTATNMPTTKNSWKISNEHIITPRTTDRVYKASTEGKSYQTWKLWVTLKTPQNKQRKTPPCICFEIRLSHLGSWRLQQCRLHLISKFSMKCKKSIRATGDWNDIYNRSSERNVQPKRETWRTNSSAFNITKLTDS